MSALATTQYPQVKIGDEPKLQPRLTFDHFLLQAHLTTGIPLGIEVAGGRPPETPTQFEIIGTEGTLTVHGGAMRGVQSGRLGLSINGQPIHLDEGEIKAMPDAAANVAGVYVMLRNDILHGTVSAPDFEHALQLTQLIDDLMTSSKEGSRKQAKN